MTRKKKTVLPAVTNSDWRDKIHFVEFSYDEEVEIQEWYSDKSPNWTDCLAEMLDSQWAVKISPPKGGDDWFITGQFRGSGEDWDGHSFTVRYPDCETAAVILYYYVTIILIRSGFDEAQRGKGRAWLG